MYDWWFSICFAENLPSGNDNLSNSGGGGGSSGGSGGGGSGSDFDVAKSGGSGFEGGRLGWSGRETLSNYFLKEVEVLIIWENKLSSFYTDKVSVYTVFLYYWLLHTLLKLSYRSCFRFARKFRGLSA